MLLSEAVTGHKQKKHRAAVSVCKCSMHVLLCIEKYCVYLFSAVLPSCAHVAVHIWKHMGVCLCVRVRAGVCLCALVFARESAHL